ncbi:hypothetical protein D9757_015450 [Collybiopsis confluens]|uniref:Uncharacterized protein n=1 Tax=Collybiopsis confluens TaxID=2823264 RepID=A0A8H5HDT5_9AGAR|nr:hypothetical protein D9757_015450 [Collybiopsis confluens]
MFVPEGTRGYYQLSSVSKKHVTEVKRAASNPQQVTVEHILRGADITATAGPKRRASDGIDNPRAKRPRTVRGSEISKSPLNNLRKNELLNETKSLQLKLDVVQRELKKLRSQPRELSLDVPLSPLTSIDDEEFPFPEPDNGIDMGEPEPDRFELGGPVPRTPPMTPPQRGNMISFATTPPARALINLAQRTWSLPGLTRTQSGSYISDISKQPTPDPEVDGLAADYGARSSSIEEEDRGVNYLATPGPTPLRASFSRHPDVPAPSVAEELSRQQLKKVEEMKRMEVDALNGEVLELRAENANLKSQVAEFELKSLNLNARLGQFTEQIARLESQVAVSENFVQIASNNLQSKSAEVAQLRVLFDEAKQSVQTSQTALEEASASFADNTSRLRALLTSAEAEVARLGLEIQSSMATCADLQECVNRANADNARCNSDLEAERQRSDNLGRDLHNSRAKADMLQARLADVEAQSIEDGQTIENMKTFMTNFREQQAQQALQLENAMNTISARRRGRYSV